MEPLIESITIQTDAAFSLSVAGIGAILFAWARLYRVVESNDLDGFKKPILLLFPFILFVASILCRYAVVSLITGYNWELVLGHAQKGEDITEPLQHFKDEYRSLIYWISSAQLASSVIGLLALAAWYVWNITTGERR